MLRDMARKTSQLADIAPDLSGSEGQILTAVVYSVTEAKKKKRSEIVAAIDHQGVNIYNVFRTIEIWDDVGLTVV